MNKINRIAAPGRSTAWGICLWLALGQVLSLYPAIAVVMLTDATKIVTSLWPILLAPGLFVSGLLIVYFRGKTEDMIFQLHPLGAGFGLLVLLFLSIEVPSFV